MAAQSALLFPPLLLATRPALPPLKHVSPSHHTHTNHHHHHQPIPAPPLPACPPAQLTSAVGAGGPEMERGQQVDGHPHPQHHRQRRRLLRQVPHLKYTSALRGAARGAGGSAARSGESTQDRRRQPRGGVRGGAEGRLGAWEGRPRRGPTAAPACPSPPLSSPL
jgi:hypothetical protein